MIELTNIKTTDQLKQLREQINTMQNEIMAHQPFVGVPVNPSVNYYSESGKLVGASTASSVNSHLFLMCFPESNGVFVADAFGRVKANDTPNVTDTPAWAVINIPAVKLPTRNASVSTFVPCDHFGLDPLSFPIDSIASGAKPVHSIGSFRVSAPFYSNTYIAISGYTLIEQGDNVCNIIVYVG